MIILGENFQIFKQKLFCQNRSSCGNIFIIFEDHNNDGELQKKKLMQDQILLATEKYIGQWLKDLNKTG